MLASIPTAEGTGTAPLGRFGVHCRPPRPRRQKVDKSVLPSGTWGNPGWLDCKKPAVSRISAAQRLAFVNPATRFCISISAFAAAICLGNSAASPETYEYRIIHPEYGNIGSYTNAVDRRGEFTQVTSELGSRSSWQASCLPPCCLPDACARIAGGGKAGKLAG